MAAASRAYARQQARTFQKIAPQQAPQQTCECCGSVLVAYQRNLSEGRD
jgi:hypothetical protein